MKLGDNDFESVGRRFESCRARHSTDETILETLFCPHIVPTFRVKETKKANLQRAPPDRSGQERQKARIVPSPPDRFSWQSGTPLTPTRHKAQAASPWPQAFHPPGRRDRRTPAARPKRLQSAGNLVTGMPCCSAHRSPRVSTPAAPLTTFVTPLLFLESRRRFNLPSCVPIIVATIYPDLS